MRPTNPVVAVAASTLDLPLTEPFGIAGGAQPMLANVLITVTCEDGTTGLGECAPFPAVSGETQASTLEAARSVFDALIGDDVAAHVPRTALLSRLLRHAPSARAGIEIAMYDAFARSLGVPLYRLFGGARAPLSTDMTITTGDTEHARRSAKAIAARGISTLKIKVGASSVDEDVERVLAAAEALAAHERRIVLDANGGFTQDEAVSIIETLAKRSVEVHLFEQPVPAERPEELAAVTRRLRPLAVPVCADESVKSAADVISLVRADACDAINLKVQKSGVAETFAMYETARAAGLMLMIGGMVESVVAMSFSAHLVHGMGGFAFIDLDTPMFVAEHPFEGGLRYEGERVLLDPAPGLGIRFVAG